MPYGTKLTLLERIDEAVLIALTDKDGLGAIDDARVAAAGADADATIDAYCQGLYTVPLSPIPPKVAQVWADLTLYNLYSLSDLEMPEIRKDRNREAIRFLEAAAAGKISLGTDTPAQADTGSFTNAESSTRIFTPEKLSGF